MNKLEYIPGDLVTWLGRKVRIDGVIVDPDTNRLITMKQLTQVVKAYLKVKI